jgi:4-carboxymuconolactone decarboxylase
MSHKLLTNSLFFSFLFVPLTMNAQSNSTQNLSSQQQSIVAISALTATGDMDKLPARLHEGLDTGLTINEVKEALVQLYAYCGFPRSLNAIHVFMDVIEKRKAKGIADNPGKEAGYMRAKDPYEQGRKVLETLTNTPQSKPAPGFGVFAPRIDTFLKEHLFGDIFHSDVLSFQQRELITISALAAMEGVSTQLQAHIKMGYNTGLTVNQLDEAATLIEKLTSRTQANTLRKAINKPVAPIIKQDMLVRISEIEIHPEHLNEYNAILKEEAAASVEKEPGVLAIFPMSVNEQPAQIRIIEIYADREAYQLHLKTPHFLHYKNSTLKMVKSLKLVDMNALDDQSMLTIFKKLK